MVSEDNEWQNKRPTYCAHANSVDNTRGPSLGDIGRAVGNIETVARASILFEDSSLILGNG